MNAAVLHAWWLAHSARLLVAAVLATHGDHETAEDLRAETFLRALVADFRGTCAPYTFLYRIMRHVWLDVRRRRRVRRAVALDAGIPSRDAAPDAIAESVERHALVLAVLARAPGANVAMARAHHAGGESQAAICERTGMSLSAVNNRLHRGRDALRRAFAAAG